tara:strand:- start:760 stop:978 length:219 start_codon:yes stop_codon:yes gene_type:complete
MDEKQLAEALNTLNECLIVIGKRLDALETYVQEIPTPDKTLYKPEGETDYMTLKQNLDFIYERLDNLEEHGM